MSLPSVAETTLFVYEKSAQHHHDNEGSENEPETDFKVMFLVQPDRLGVRVRISDEVARGSLIADVAVTYEWDRPATPEDDLDRFVQDTAIPQALSCASTILVDAARSVGSRAPFYGLEAVDRLIEVFHQSSRKKSLSESLARQIEKIAANEAAGNLPNDEEGQ